MIINWSKRKGVNSTAQVFSVEDTMTDDLYFNISEIKLSVPPIWIYIPSDAHLSPPIVWYIQKCMLIWKICFYFTFVYAICLSKMKTRQDDLAGCCNL